VVDYVRRKYGDDHVAQIVTFGTMAARAAIRDVGRALNMTYAEVDVVAKLVPAGPGALHITLKDALEEMGFSAAALLLGDEPGVAQAKPVVGQLHLLAVNDLLLEDAQLIADGIAGGHST